MVAVQGPDFWPSPYTYVHSVIVVDTTINIHIFFFLPDITLHTAILLFFFFHIPLIILKINFILLIT
jgi:hypothetical protein